MSHINIFVDDEGNMHASHVNDRHYVYRIAIYNDETLEIFYDYEEYYIFNFNQIELNVNKDIVVTLENEKILELIKHLIETIRDCESDITLCNPYELANSIYILIRHIKHLEELSENFIKDLGKLDLHVVQCKNANQ